METVKCNFCGKVESWDLACEHLWSHVRVFTRPLDSGISDSIVRIILCATCARKFKMNCTDQVILDILKAPSVVEAKESNDYTCEEVEI